MATSVDAIHKSSDQINPDQMYVTKKSEYNVKVASDKRQTCYISGICSLPSGHTVVADYNNNRVKMFDKDYNLSSDLVVNCNPQDICTISPSEVAVTTVNNTYFKLIRVSNGKLDILNFTKLPHATLGISCHQEELYITSGTALYHYDLLGNLLKKLYEDTGGGITVYKCAFSPDGNWIYVTNFAQNKLITLATDGTLISTFTDPELQGPKGLHITPTGQVLVCGFYSHSVIQIDREGKKKMATLASQKDGISYPVSVYYNSNSHQIIVGVYANNKISVMEL